MAQGQGAGPKGLLQPWDQFVQSKLADFDRHADDLKIDSLKQDIGLNRLIQDTPFVEKDLQLVPNAQKANRFRAFPSATTRGSAK